MSDEEFANIYQITNLAEFLDASRVWLYTIYGGLNPSESMEIRYIDLETDEQEEIDKVLNIKEVLNIAQQYIKFDEHNGLWIITENQYEELLIELNGRMTSNLLASMVSSGILESAYDSEINDFVFWRTNEKDNNEQQADEV
jgi:hypothetical protein